MVVRLIAGSSLWIHVAPTDGMPWRFVPTQRSVKLHPGQSTLAFYTAHNKSDKAITGECSVK